MRFGLTTAVPGRDAPRPEDQVVTLHRHTIHQHSHHYCWDNSIDPVMTVAPGETITFDVAEASDGQVFPGCTVDVFDGYDDSRVNPVTGPVFVDGAEPGDVLVVRLEHYAPSGWGWSANIPGFGLLAEDFQEPALMHWTYDPRGVEPLMFANIAQIPLAPFAGTIGVAPAAPGRHSIIPPRRMGGNMDVRDLIAGSTLYLPVEVPGALFSIGDTHAAQGDGEVSGTAIESPMQVTLTLDLQKNDKLHMPRLIRPAAASISKAYDIHVTCGIGPELFVAAQDSVRGMIDVLVRTHKLDPIDAYMLCGVAGDLRISQIVDAPNWTVTFHLPDSIFI